ncbi:hypothetical protein [Streptomyces sp. NPDC055060]
MSATIIGDSKMILLGFLSLAAAAGASSRHRLRSTLVPTDPAFLAARRRNFRACSGRRGRRAAPVAVLAVDGAEQGVFAFDKPFLR